MLDYYYDDELQIILDFDNILSDNDISLEELVSIILYCIIIYCYLIQYV